MMQDDVPPYTLFNYALPTTHSPTDLQEFSTVLLIDALAACRRGYNPDRILTIGTGAGRLSGVYLRVYEGQTTVLSVDSTQTDLTAAVEGHRLNGYAGRAVYYIGRDMHFLSDIGVEPRFALIAFNPYYTGVLDPGESDANERIAPQDRCLAGFILAAQKYLSGDGRAFIVIETTRSITTHQNAAAQFDLYFSVIATRIYEGRSYSVVALSRSSLRDSILNSKSSN